MPKGLGGFRPRVGAHGKPQRSGKPTMDTTVRQPKFQPNAPPPSNQPGSFPAAGSPGEVGVRNMRSGVFPGGRPRGF